MILKNKLFLSGAVITAIALILIFTIPRTYTVKLNGSDQTLVTRAWTVQDALQRGGLTLQPEDIVSPPLNQLLLGIEEIEVDQARPVQITVLPAQKEYELTSADRNLADLLSQASVKVGPEDRLVVNAEPATLNTVLDYADEYTITVKQAVSLDIAVDGETIQIRSSADTLADALTEADITLQEGDRVVPDIETNLDSDLEVNIKRARPVKIMLQDETIRLPSAAETVGDALAEAGVTLQGLDYSQPSADLPLPDNGEIRVVRVSEKVIITQTPIPYTSEYVQSDQVELDKTDVVTPGEFGVEVTRTTTRYEDGEEVNKVEEITWIAKEPQNQVVGRGTKVVVRTMDTPDGPIEYWRAVNVYATSYSPCRSGVDRCYYGTSSGLPVQRGVIAVTRSWYNLMVGQYLYVPGYGKGVIADVGGGIDGKYWIDLGYSDDDYVPWYHNITVYFLTPVPDYVPWILP